MPDCAATAARWRAWCRQNGLGEIHLSYVQAFESPDPESIGFDAAVEFPPNRTTGENITADQQLINPNFEGQVLDWRIMAKQHALRESPSYRLYPGVNTGWDNEPRRPGGGRTYAHSSPRGYRDWLRATIESRLDGNPDEERLIFINAWNEWAEGAVLEPDSSMGYAWLERTRQALQARARPLGALQTPDSIPTVVIHAWYEDEFDEILSALEATDIHWRIIVTTGLEKADAMAAKLSARDLQAEIHVGENHGRDILPFLRIAELLLEQRVDAVLKLHTKKSTHLKDGDQWRRDLIGELLDPREVDAALSAFTKDAQLGLIGAYGHLLNVPNYIGANSRILDYLLARIGVREPSNKSALFPSGSMFWVRLESLRPLLDAHLKPEEFEPEAEQQDGTLAHGIERLIGICVDAAGFKIQQTNGLDGRELESKSVYPYAAPSRGRRET
jgi:lipopolysaccharide biosynthesis protein